MNWASSVMILFWGAVGLIIYLILLGAKKLIIFFSWIFRSKNEQIVSKEIYPFADTLSEINSDVAVLSDLGATLKSTTIHSQGASEKIFTSYARKILINDPLKPLQNIADK
jgi:hypothetical protein